MTALIELLSDLDREVSTAAACALPPDPLRGAGHISIKGIAYPVATYKVVDRYQNLGAERRFIHEERPSLRLDLDLDAMSADDRSHAVAVLREALNRLSALE